MEFRNFCKAPIWTLNFPLKSLKLDWVTLHSLTFQLHFQSNQYEKLAPVLSRLCNSYTCVTEIAQIYLLFSLHSSPIIFMYSSAYGKS